MNIFSIRFLKWVFLIVPTVLLVFSFISAIHGTINPWSEAKEFAQTQCSRSSIWQIDAFSIKGNESVTRIGVFVCLKPFEIMLIKSNNGHFVVVEERRVVLKYIIDYAFLVLILFLGIFLFKLDGRRNRAF